MEHLSLSAWWLCGGVGGQIGPTTVLPVYCVLRACQNCARSLIQVTGHYCA